MINLRIPAFRQGPPEHVAHGLTRMIARATTAAELELVSHYIYSNRGVLSAHASALYTLITDKRQVVK